MLACVLLCITRPPPLPPSLYTHLLSYLPFSGMHRTVRLLPRAANADLAAIAQRQFQPAVRCLGHKVKPVAGAIPYGQRKVIRVKAEGKGILTDPFFNKGMAFTMGERDRLGIRGLVPPRKLSMEDQIARVHEQLDREETPIRKALFMRDLHDRNETLYHRVLIDNIEELAPIVYTPTVGQVCQEFGTQFRRPRGMYFSTIDQGDMGAMLHNWPAKRVDVVVVTDGSRILGLGDLGACGMGIPIGKLALYCAAGGIAPHRVLPVMLDFGTDNEELLKSRIYPGIRQPRVGQQQYFELLDEFMACIYHRYPSAFVQFEDFCSSRAQHILNRYREKHLCFNDDIQGTGATAVAGLMSALRQTGQDVQALKSQRIVIAGAGSAGIGVAKAIYEAMVTQGLDPELARKAFWVCDVNGVLHPGAELSAEQALFARDDEYGGMSLAEVTRAAKPTILLGLTAVRGLFSEEIIKSMCEHTERPIIFPLSNPTSVEECTAQEAYEWTDGRVVFASGSPFEPVEYKGKTYIPSQCNNMFIFPGVGLAAGTAGIKQITDGQIYDASVALAECLSDRELLEGRVFPDIKRIREVSQKVAIGVIKRAHAEGLTNAERFKFINMADDAALGDWLHKKMYDPVYVPLVDDVYSKDRAV